jgi:hypothetical protein
VISVVIVPVPLHCSASDVDDVVVNT